MECPVTGARKQLSDATYSKICRCHNINNRQNGKLFGAVFPPFLKTNFFLLFARSQPVLRICIRDQVLLGALDPDPGSRIEKNLDLESGIRDEHPR
jgi:hypothetical protein